LGDGYSKGEKDVHIAGGLSYGIRGLTVVVQSTSIQLEWGEKNLLEQKVMEAERKPLGQEKKITMI